MSESRTFTDDEIGECLRTCVIYHSSPRNFQYTREGEMLAQMVRERDQLRARVEELELGMAKLDDLAGDLEKALYPKGQS